MPHTQPADPEREDWYTPTLLTREIVRQGMLLAARDEFSVATRDEALREPLSAAGAPSRFDFDVGHVQAKRVDYVLRQGERILLDGSFPYQFGHAHAIEAMQADAVEALSRGDFADAIAKAGYERRKRPIALDAPLPRDIDAALDLMDLYMQFEAVRLAHRAIDEDGESIALLGALVRGYANLGQLTAFHHSSMRHAFAARAVLYGTRMIRIKEDSPQGYWHRAYAFTLMGLTKASMFDLEKADQIRQQQDPEAGEPNWLKHVHMANHYDYAALNLHVLDKGEHLPLAALMWFRSVEFSNSPMLTIEVARRAIQVNPFCTRLIHGAHRAAGVAYRQMTTDVAFRMAAASAVQRLSQLALKEKRLSEVLPNDRDALAGPLSRTKFAAELADKSGTDKDLDEPSLAVLGRLINEEDVLHVGLRAQYEQDMTDVDSGDFLDEMKPVYREHPLGLLIDSLRLPQNLPPQSYEAIVGAAEFKDTNFVSSDPLLERLPRSTRFKKETYQEFRGHHRAQRAPTDLDYQIGMTLTTDVAGRVQLAHWMFDINPHAPYRYVVLIEHDWERSKEHLDEWDERYGQHPAVALALARRFVDNGELDKAEEYVTGYIAVVPDYAAYVQLARIHHRRGDTDKMLRAANDFLGQEDYGYSHAAISKLIAYTLMAEGNYEGALSWAKRSDEAHFAWGRQALADCIECQGDLREAARIWYSIIDRSYNTSHFYEFATRTGYGNLQLAWRLKSSHLKRIDPNGRTLATYAAFHAAVQGKLAEAAASLQRLLHDAGDHELGLIAAALATRAKDEGIVTDVLEAIATSNPASSPAEMDTRAVAEMLLRFRSAKQIDKEFLDELAQSPTSAAYPMIHFVAGAFLDAEGHKEDALAHYREAARSRFRGSFAVILSWIRLRELGEDPLKLAPHYVGIDADPQAFLNFIGPVSSASDSAAAP